MNNLKDKIEDERRKERTNSLFNRQTENLSSSEIQKQKKRRASRESQYALLAMFCRAERDAALTIPAIAVIFALGTLFWAPKEEVLLWISFVLLSKFLLLYLCHLFLRQPQTKINVTEWYYVLVAAMGLNGIAWASLSFVGIWSEMDPNSGDVFKSNIFLFAILITLLGIRMSFASTVMGILYAGTLPFTLSVVCRLILLDDPFYFTLAFMAAGLNAYFIFLAHGLHETASHMLEYQHQKNLLVKELKASRRQAEQANIAKSQFLATMSHELRTPLNAIMGFSEMIKKETFGKLSNPNYLEYAKNIHESGEHLLSLINDILDLSRIEAGRYDLAEEPLWISDVVSDCRSLMRLKARNQGIMLIQNDENNLPQILADERALRQICLNLIGNALKFTPEGGRIFLSIGSTIEGGQYLSVKDTGPGIAQEEMQKVLEPFGQGTLGRQHVHSGTGLGLAIVKKLVELHGGLFELLSVQDKGTEAIIVFPKNRVISETLQSNELKREFSEKIADFCGTQTSPPHQKPQSHQISFGLR